jgi:mannose-6-phosphate isomerase-like protein (cupin superfamily)
VKEALVAYTVVDAKDVEPRNGVFRQMRRALGVRAFGINLFELPPEVSGFEHDERGTEQEEVYAVIAGSGHMTVDGDELELYPGRWILVTPDTTRNMHSGPDGLSWIVAGAPVGSYEPHGPF